ncbi:MAG: hypothetical protein WCK72_05300 [Actinomycetes bacterium]
MSLIEIEPEVTQKKKFPKGLLAIGLISAIASLGLAVGALITLNDAERGRAELGTGMIVVAACDPDGITVTPYQSFANKDTGSKFTFNAIELSGISKLCAGKDFRLSVRDLQGDPLTLSTDADGRAITSVRIYFHEFTGADNSVSLDGVLTDEFTLVGSDSASGLINVAAIHGLDQIQDLPNIDPSTGLSAWNLSSPATFWAMSDSNNDVSIVFNPKAQTSGPNSGEDQIAGFADSQSSYKILLESLDHSLTG